MRIGIDIDDVITNTSDMFKKYAYKYGDNFFSADEMEKNMKYIVRGNFITDKLKQFASLYIKEILENVTLKDNVIEVLTNLRKRGFEVFLVTARGSNIFPEAEEVTTKYLNYHNVPYDRIIFNAYDKHAEIMENKVELMIDDSVDICEDLSSRGIQSYLFTTEVNIERETLVPRLNNWLELEKTILSLNTE